MPTNDFVPFCPTDTGTNLESQSAYLADANRTNGNQPGLASSKLNNKALRQATFIASQLAQYLSNDNGADVLDNANTASLLAQIQASIQAMPPVITSHLSGTGTHNCTYYFFVASANATVGATYTNNGVTFTVSTTLTAGTLLVVTGTGYPAVTGTLTKATGTGDAAITFYAFRPPLFLTFTMIGGGGGGSGSGTTPGAGGTGGTTTFGNASCTGGVGGTTGGGGAGGTATLGSGITGIPINGGNGGVSSGDSLANIAGGMGAVSPFGGAGAGAAQGGNTGKAATTNSGSGGGGASWATASNGFCGGGAGAYIQGFIISPIGGYSWGVGVAGTAGTAGSGTLPQLGGAGGSGSILVEEIFQ